MNMNRFAALVAIYVIAVPMPVLSTPAFDTAFTYQGQLKHGGVPAEGWFDFIFTLHDSETGGGQIGDAIALDDEPVTNGLFTITLDFRDGSFEGQPRWLEVAVRPGESSENHATLSPRQRITPTPYAIALPGLRTHQNDTSPNLVGGHVDNIVDVDVVGATIGGGGLALKAEPPRPNHVSDHFGTIGGGLGNTVGNSDTDPTDAEAATVGGGMGNQAGNRWATVAGGASNTATASGATIGGGSNNHATRMYTTVAGGNINEANRSWATIGGGHVNVASGEDSTVSGGHNNMVAITGNGAVIGGGTSNTATNNNATIGGGQDNEASGSGATIDGGRYNHVPGYNASVGGGALNVASGSHSVVTGGFSRKSLTSR